ncbi:MAG TPA: SRPBCC domain-containing protein [Thermoanaerobaculia bacterium]|nr:SRPBCC domain-containing protein [Thermoanaerobaculia bacterium]
MSLKKDASGRRWVEVEVEVPGTPEQVWDAIATGPGVSSWFVPTEVEEGEGGTPVKVVSHFGPGMDSVAAVTAWEPPRRFAAESEDLGANAPPVVTEWIVEARSGGTCVVRVVHSLSTSSDDWDDQLTSWEYGWPDFFRILRLYLTHFHGQRGSAFQLMGVAPEPASEAWDALTGSLGLSGAAMGERRSTAAGAPPLAGLVELSGEGEDSHQLLLRLDEPAPGIAHLFAMPMGGQVYLVIRFYLYGDRAAAAVAREEPSWQAWMKEQFPSAGDASNVA